MIVREEFDRLRLGCPRPYRCSVFLPIVGWNQEVDWLSSTSLYITLVPEYDPNVNYPNVQVKIWDVPWRWYCQDCYAASGDKDSVFKTDWVRREDLGGKGNRDGGGFSDPTYEQQRQMNEHARQHSIMWAWAKGLK